MLLQWSRPAAPVTMDELLDVAGAALGRGAVGMISSPAGHDLVRWDGEQLTTSGGPAELAEVFHLRLFTPDTELRWVHTGSRRGAAVVLGESATGPAGWTADSAGWTADSAGWTADSAGWTADSAGWTADSAPIEEVLDGQYALWGRRFTTVRDGWCRAYEGRIGWIDVPAATPAETPNAAGQDWPEEFLAVQFREYLTSDEDGNATVLDERLLGFVVAKVEFSGDR